MLFGIASAQTNVFPSSGNVGIGTATPDSRLQIDVESNKEIRAGVGISTTLTDFSTGGPGFFFSRGHDGANDIAGIFQYSASGGNRLALATRDDLVLAVGGPSIYSAAPERMRITSNGNVGIGTATPDSRLQIDVESNKEIRAGVGTSTTLTDFSTGGPGFFFSRGHDGANDIAGIFQYSASGGNRLALATRDDLVLAVGGSSIYSAAPERMRITSNGNVGIGTTTPSHKLAVNGTIRAMEVIVDTGWADYVFADDYHLAPLDEVEAHIRERKHLPGIPSAQDVVEQGVSIGEMQALLLSKIEELTLHVITQEKRANEQKQRLDEQSLRIDALERENTRLRIR